MPNREASDDEIDLDEPALAAIADAILDGGAIDWNQVQSSASTDPDLARELRALASVAALHRTLSSGDPTTSNEALPNTTQLTWGQLQLREKVGQGAFGEVFRAWDPHLSREVALKLLGPAIGLGADDRSWVLKEARFLAAIRHPNVVTVYGADRIDGRVGFWTEFIHGRTLAELVHDEGWKSADEAAAIGIDVCRAVSAMHRAGLLHRDIKANNVMRERDGRTVLLDFGATKNFLPDITPEAVIGDPNGPTGTPLYVAPELWGEREATPQSDIYSVGVLLYFLVTGTYPVQGATVGDVAQAHRAGKRLALGDARPDLPASFVATVERAIATDPATRFPAIQELEQALSAVGRPTRATFSSRKRLAGLALMVVAGVAVYLTWPSGQAPSMIPAVQPSAPVADPIAPPPTAPQQPRDPPAEPRKATADQTTEPALVKIAVPATGRFWSRPSLDGRYFAFIDASGGVGVWDAETNPVSMVVTPIPGERATSALISRDGERIAYVLEHPDGSHDVHVARRDGSRPILVLEPRTGYEPQLADWSHDGKELVCWLVQAKQADLVVLPVSGGDRQVLASKPADRFAHASMSPDGRFVVFGQATANNADAVIVGRDQAPARVFEAGGGMPEWTADGQHLLVLRQSPIATEPRTRDAWLVPVEDGLIVGEPVKAAENIGAMTGYIQAFPTNDGRLLTVVQRYFNEIWTAPFDAALGRTTAALVRLIPSRIGGQSSPSWSPDGKTIAFFEMRPHFVPGANPVASLQTLDASSGRVHPVRPKLFWQGGLRPAWLPDGLHVIVWGQDTDSRGRRGHYRVNVRTGEATPLFDPAGSTANSGPAWALPDGNRFTYQDPRGWVSRTFEGQESVLIESKAWNGLGRFALAREGGQWAFAAAREGRSVIIVQDAGGEARVLVAAGPKETVDVQCWTSDGSALFFTRGDSQSTSPRSIWIVNRDGTNAREVGLTIPANQPNPIAINPDGTRIALPERIIGHELWIRQIPVARR